MATRVIDDSKLQNIAVAIQGKDGGGQMTVDQMPTRIEQNLQSKAVLDSVIDGSITSIESDAAYIRQKAFTMCNHLKTMVFSKVLRMGTDVFVDCASLENVLFLKLESMGAYAFIRCPSFNLILHGRVRLPNINAFNLCSAIIYVKPEDLEWYSTATNWSTLYVQNRIKSIEDLTGADLVWYQEQLARYQAQTA